MRGPPEPPRPGNSQSFFPSEASKIDPKINLVFVRFGSDLNAKMDPKSIPKPTPRRSKNDLETDTPKTEESNANFERPNHQKSLTLQGLNDS